MSPIESLDTFRLSEHWSPEQALAVLQLTETISEALWARYASDLGKLIAEQHGHDESPQLEMFDSDDPLPF